ncbi:MAG: hypothetical protein JW909_10365 [Planctomycetes bacterium]|nr:hypothetical protein [Planctomycetota bacterium]
MSTFNRLVTVVGIVTLLGCGGEDKKPEVSADIDPAPTGAVTGISKALPGGTESAGDAEGGKVVKSDLPVPKPTAGSDNPNAAGGEVPASAKVRLTDAGVKSIISAMGELETLAQKMDTTGDGSPEAAMELARAEGHLEELNAIARNHGFEDGEAFLASYMRLVFAFSYVNMKTEFEEGMKDLDPQQRALMNSMMGAQLNAALTELKKQMDAMGITEEETNIVFANSAALKAALDK